MDAILQVNNLTKQYSDFKLDNVSFSLPKGTIMGLIGENGAGKSTTINAILDLIKKDDGTFSFDEQSKWTKYAMIMPVSKKDYVISKFIVLAIFSLVGVLVGTVLGTIGGLLLHKINSVTSFLMSLGAAAIGFIIADIFGSVSIPLLFKFGAEKARMMTLIAFVVPVIVCYGAYQLLMALGVSFTTKLIVILLCASPVITVVWNYIMYKISYWIFDNKELLN